MDYEFFLGNYDAAAYDHRGGGAIPTPDVFVFFERPGGRQRVEEELMPPGAGATARIRAWVEKYAGRPDQAPNVSLFYRDRDVDVVRISRPAPTYLDPDPQDGLLAIDTTPDSSL